MWVLQPLSRDWMRPNALGPSALYDKYRQLTNCGLLGPKETITHCNGWQLLIALLYTTMGNTLTLPRTQNEHHERNGM